MSRCAQLFASQHGSICDSISAMEADPEPLPDDIDALKADVAAPGAPALLPTRR